jgi:hypothetical protein
MRAFIKRFLIHDISISDRAGSRQQGSAPAGVKP